MVVPVIRKWVLIGTNHCLQSCPHHTAPQPCHTILQYPICERVYYVETCSTAQFYSRLNTQCHTPVQCTHTYLLSLKVISVVHVLASTEVSHHLSYFCEELNVQVLLLLDQYSMLQRKDGAAHMHNGKSAFIIPASLCKTNYQEEMSTAPNTSPFFTSRCNNCNEDSTTYSITDRIPLNGSAWGQSSHPWTAEIEKNEHNKLPGLEREQRDDMSIPWL